MIPIKAEYSVEDGRITQRKFESADVPDAAIADYLSKYDCSIKQGGESNVKTEDEREAGRDSVF